MGLPFYPQPKSKSTHKNRINPRRSAAGTFSPQVRRVIIERDNGLCVRCGCFYNQIHHVIFRSQGGKGTADNGVCVCTECHGWAHAGREGREWFEDYRNNKLLRGMM